MHDSDIHKYKYIHTYKYIYIYIYIYIHAWLKTKIWHFLAPLRDLEPGGTHTNIESSTFTWTHINGSECLDPNARIRIYGFGYTDPNTRVQKHGSVCLDHKLLTIIRYHHYILGWYLAVWWLAHNSLAFGGVRLLKAHGHHHDVRGDNSRLGNMFAQNAPAYVAVHKLPPCWRGYSEAEAHLFSLF
jgi:hypothetical protein